MDRIISKEEIRGRRKRTIWYVAIALAVVSGGIWLMRDLLGASVRRAEIRIAIAETGDVDNTLTASGDVQPEFEQVITSPIAAVLQEAYFHAGSNVQAGDRILALDKTFTQIEFDKQKDGLELKRNSIIRIKLDLDKSYFDIQIQDSIKACQITSLKADLENARRLFQAGGGTREAIEQAETRLRIAELEKRQLENDIRSRQKSMQASIRETEITASIQEKELSEMERKLLQADILATRNGVLTYVNRNLGSKINEGEILARIADLDSYQILGSIADTYGPQLQEGMAVIIRVNEVSLRGKLVNIHPTVANNVVHFDVALDDRQAGSQLRPKMKVELYLVTASHTNTVRVRNGPAFKGGSAQDVFVLHPDGKTAERRTVEIGLSNFDFVEITRGLQAGETVILSDMSQFKNIRKIEIR